MRNVHCDEKMEEMKENELGHKMGWWECELCIIIVSKNYDSSSGGY